MNRRELAFDAALSKRHKDENGFLHINISPISKATVNPYYGREIPGWRNLGLSPEGIYYGLRDPDELKKAADTFNGLPVLMGHSMDSAAEPQKELRVGSTGTDAVFETPYLMQSLSITDADAIARIENETRKEISCAYQYEPDMNAGDFEGVDYDFVMRNIRGNHVALVAEGRAGPDVVVADSLPEEMKKRSGEKMAKKNLAKKSFLERRVIAMDEAMEEAKDAEIDLEKSGVSASGLASAANAMEALESGVEPKKIGLGIGADASIDDIIAKYLPEASEEAKTILRTFLGKLKGEPAAADEEPEAAKDEETAADEDPEAAKDEEPEAAKDAEPSNKEGAMDEKMVKNIRAMAKQETIAAMRALAGAAKKCTPLVGTNLDAFAFDSAEDIYAKALQVNGVDIKGYPKSAYRGMVDMMLKNAPAMPRAAGVAFDAAPPNLGGDKDLDAVFANLGSIKTL